MEVEAFFCDCPLRINQGFVFALILHAFNVAGCLTSWCISRWKCHVRYSCEVGLSAGQVFDCTIQKKEAFNQMLGIL